MSRLDRAGCAVANVLRALPADDEPGELAADLALILALMLGRAELLFVASAVMMAMDAEDAERLAEAALTDLRSADPAEAEAERMRRQWAAHCAGSDYRPPALTRRAHREAAKIRLEETPRAKLAEAWAAAGDRDRADLLNRATGRAA